MATATLTKRFTFEAAHQLPNHDGQCARLHGHSYKLEVLLFGPIRPSGSGPSEGMVVDFAEVTTVWKRDIEPTLDHQFLNEVLSDRPTTAENLAHWLLAKFQFSGLPVVGIRLWETESGYVTVSIDDL